MINLGPHAAKHVDWEEAKQLLGENLNTNQGNHVYYRNVSSVAPTSYSELIAAGWCTVSFAQPEALFSHEVRSPTTPKLAKLMFCIFF